MKGAHPMPNLSSLIRLGIVSTTCSFTDSVVVAIAACQSYRYRRAHKLNILWWNSSCIGADWKIYSCCCGLLQHSNFIDSSSLESQLQLFVAVGHEGLALQGSGATWSPYQNPLNPAEPPSVISLIGISATKSSPLQRKAYRSLFFTKLNISFWRRG